MAWLTSWITSKALRAILPYLAVAALCAALAVGWRVSVSNAYDRGYAARAAEQKAVDAQAVINIWREYHNATDPDLSVDAADCILRQLAGVGNGEYCGDL